MAALADLVFIPRGDKALRVGGQYPFLCAVKKLSFSVFTFAACDNLKQFKGHAFLGFRHFSFSVIRVVASLIMEKTARGVKSLRHYFHSFTTSPRQFSPPTAHDTGDGGGHAD